MVWGFGMIPTMWLLYGLISAWTWIILLISVYIYKWFYSDEVSINTTGFLLALFIPIYIILPVLSYTNGAFYENSIRILPLMILIWRIFSQETKEKIKNKYLRAICSIFVSIGTTRIWFSLLLYLTHISSN